MSLFKKKRSETENLKAMAELMRESENEGREYKERTLIRRCAEEEGLIRDFPEMHLYLDEELIAVEQEKVAVHTERLTVEEVDKIVDKLDLLVSREPNEERRILIIKNFKSIINLVRIVKYEDKMDFKSSRGMGGQLDIRWLESFDIGSKALADDYIEGVSGVSDELRDKIKAEHEAIKNGLYENKERQGGWLSYDYFAGETKIMIPEQAMNECAGVIHLGILNHKHKHKQIMGYASWKLDGMKTSKIPFKYSGQLMEFECPIIVRPECKQELELMAINNGDTKLELVSLLVLASSLNEM